MSRLFGHFSVFLVALAANVGSTAFAQDPGLTRIETRPFYGATVTIEEGVRVFRPLPPTAHMIINPSRSPLNLSISYERRASQDEGSTAGTNQYANAGNTYANYANGSGYADQPSSTSGSYGGYDNNTNNAATYGAKGKRLNGFASHGVRVNGRYADQHPQSGRSGPQGHRATTQQPISQYHAPHGFSYSAAKRSTRPLHLPPIGYGAQTYKLSRNAYAPRNYAMHNVPPRMPNVRVHGPVMRPAPAMPIQSYRVMPAPAPIYAPMHAAPRMGMGQSGHIVRGVGGMGRGR
jgi:hypothetical protein